MFLNKKCARGGFTLLELLVVVLIVGILAGIALPQYRKTVVRSKYATLKNITKSFYQSQQVYYMVNNVYATSFNDLDIDTGYKGTANNITVDQNIYCTIEQYYLYCIYPKIKLSYVIQYNGIVFCVPYDNKLSPIICREETNHQGNSSGWYQY